MKVLNDRRDAYIRLLLLMAIFFTAVFFYLPMIKNWFLSDDTHWISSSAVLQFKEIFFVPERYRSLASNFTPMLGASFKIDWILFKMNPLGYSVHNLLSLVAVSVVFFFFLRLYVTEKTALFGVLLLLLNPITVGVTSWFCTRHYIEGLFWSLLSLFFFVGGDRKGKVSAAAGIFYLLASLNKEVYVILPAVAFVLSKESLRKRLKQMAPLWAGLLIYSLWRIWIMEGIGGYPSNQPFALDAIVPLVIRIINFLAIDELGAYSALMYFILLFLIFSVRSTKGVLLFLILIIPLFPITNILGGDYRSGRFFFHVTVYLICAVCLSMEYQRIKCSRLFSGTLLLTCLLLIVLFIKQDIHLLAAIKDNSLRAKEAAMTFMYSERRYIKSDQPLWFFEGLRKINRDFFKREIRTRLVPTEKFLNYAAPEKLEEIRESGADIPYNEILEYQKRLRRGPLTIHIRLENYKITWDFGPHKDGVYTFLHGPISGLYFNSSDLRAAGKYMLSKGGKESTPNKIFIRILYRSRDGGEVISPEFELTIPGSQKIEYGD